MKRTHLLLLAALVVASAFGALLGAPPIGVEASALSSGASGLLAARLYLEARGTPTRLLDQNPTELAGEPPGNSLGKGTVLVVSFPWQRIVPGQRTRLDAHVAAGGTLLLAYTGKLLSAAETPLLESLGLSWHEMKVRRPLHPLRWRELAGEEWWLEPDPELADLPPVRVSALERVPTPPTSARVFFRQRGGLPVIFSYPWGRGEVIVVPAQALANGRLSADGNADLLETLRVRLAPASWVFDEYHHGLSAATSPEALRLGRVFDLYLAHLAVVYLLGVLCLARRFGPAWIEAPVATGSVAAFLVGLGALHHRLGHHGEAAALLVSRARELDPRLHIPAAAPAPADARSLVRVARDVAQAQAKKGE